MVVFVALANSVWLGLTFPDHLLLTVAANLASLIAALVAYVLISAQRRPAVDVLTIGVLLIVDLSIAMVAGISVDFARLASGYSLLLPPIVALMVPWSVRSHVAWLALHATAVVAVTVTSAPNPSSEGPRLVLGLLVLASGVSLVGNLSSVRARVVEFDHLERIRSLNREARRRDVSLSRLNTLLEGQARTDQLTGLGNRMALDDDLARIRNRVDRYRERFAMVMLDLDRFKQINDVFGHVAGDEVLRRVARAIGATSRASDSTCRFGGEEFMALVKLDGTDDASAVAERLRRAVCDLALPHPGNPPFGIVTTSVGVTVIDRTSLAGSDDAWLHAADMALYEAKRLGRNQVRIAEPSTPSRPAPLR